MANPRLFVLDMKFKSRWKMNTFYVMVGFVLLLFVLTEAKGVSKICGSSVCDFGKCENGTCICDPGWTGKTCGHCVGRVRLTKEHGFISDGTGNYSVDSKCAWLIDTGIPNRTIQFYLEEFATECGWDHIFIHDGDSAFSSLTAALSGRMVMKAGKNISAQKRSVTSTESGKAYIHFYSDAAYNIAGFNISYRFGGCPKGCSGHGSCNYTTETCTCNLGWQGADCDTIDCSAQCSSNSTLCNPQCVCDLDPKSEDCVRRQVTGYWEPVLLDSPVHPRTSHRAVVLGNYMWSVGGYNFNRDKFQMVTRYDFLKKKWDFIKPNSSSDPPERFGHTVVEFEDDLYMYGGVVNKTITNELFKFSTKFSRWTKLDPASVGGASSADMLSGNWKLPVAVTGHSAHVVNGKMLIIFGHSPIYGYMHNVQTYNFDSKHWRIVETFGALVTGAYGHSSVYDDISGQVYVFGGSSPVDKGDRLTDQLFAYDPENSTWTILRRSQSPRYLHSAVILNGQMLIFGGNTHNDTSGNQIAKCYSSDVLTYDLGKNCDSWRFLPQTDALMSEKLARYGHTAVVYKNEVYVFAGFSGVMLNDMFKYTPGNCSIYLDEGDCENSTLCTWNKGQCKVKSTCANSTESNARFCGEWTLCGDCVSTNNSCFWCGNKCSHTTCDNNKKTSQNCSKEQNHRCDKTHNCELCKAEPGCSWNDTKCQLTTKTTSTKSQTSSSKECRAPCSSYTNCENCTEQRCMWCTNLERCVDTNSYTASFPYGICMEWTMNKRKCPKTLCENLQTCDECHSNPRCGWCNSQNDTGLGKCMEGGDSGDNAQTCPKDRWFFTSCPLCQCNGHSFCKNGTDICEDCQSHTTGPRCERCKPGYYGNAKVGGLCQPCECNGHADMCDTETGKCFCRTKGILEPRCDKCDDGNKYYGNAKTGTCYYDLATDYQYTFDMSKESDRYLTQINFMNIPSASDRDVDFTLNCSGKAMINITWHSKSTPEEQSILSAAECGYIKRKFEHKTYNFANSENTTFRIYVYDFQTPFWLQISFVMISSFDIFLFVAIFIGCFLSLMLIAALLWKIKQRYDLYRRRQRMVVEMEQMASRPFATVCTEIEPKIDAYIGPGALAMKREPPDIKRKKPRSTNKPSPIAYEPLYGNKVAVISLLVRLPSGDEDFTPPGQSGLAVASALVTMGSQRKPSLEKGDKSKTKKQSHPNHPENCI